MNTAIYNNYFNQSMYEAAYAALGVVKSSMIAAALIIVVSINYQQSDLAPQYANAVEVQVGKSYPPPDPQSTLEEKLIKLLNLS